MNAIDHSSLLKTYRWSSSNASDRFPVENPATGDVIAMVQGGSEVEVDAAVRAANHAYQTDWRWRTPRERGALLLECANVLEAHADELAELVSSENGKPVELAKAFDLAFLVGSFRYFGSLIDKLPAEFYDSGAIYSSVVIEPLGVVAGIIPFNWPPIHTGGKVAPALAVGNTIVLKPGEQAPLTIMRIVELINTVLPKDVVHAVPGLGITVGKALVTHPLVRKVSFTGSTKSGAAVLKSIADNITPATLELGGKNAFVVFEDADIDRAVRDALEGGYYNQGEACTAASRILVHHSIHDEFVERLSIGVRKLKVGNGAHKGTHIGPMVTRAHQEQVLRYLQIAADEGAVIAAEAELPSDAALKNGYFVKPTLYRNVTRDMRIFKEEIFGPIVTVTAFHDDDEAIDIANDSEYGLVAGVYSRDSEKAFRAARRIDVGVVFINNFNRAFLGTPFGGAKGSGYGREHCIHTLTEFGRFKSMRFPSGAAPIPSWQAVNDIFG
ncbi:aldehyde dehydrogenase family protein [Noviherbaspirillum aerium]|uniref:aldehyde dehydrogenase family protein n=1 Tax=Noviherbaspirillum aerium TaxID=2588497 RepID=UPI001CEFA240|nr:aldehyde dehydrogenase family protein [Noviherbaspirillum aerium]